MDIRKQAISHSSFLDARVQFGLLGRVMNRNYLAGLEAGASSQDVSHGLANRIAFFAVILMHGAAELTPSGVRLYWTHASTSNLSQ